MACVCARKMVRARRVLCSCVFDYINLCLTRCCVRFAFDVDATLHPEMVYDNTINRLHTHTRAHGAECRKWNRARISLE